MTGVTLSRVKTIFVVKQMSGERLVGCLLRSHCRIYNRANLAGLNGSRCRLTWILSWTGVSVWALLRILVIRRGVLLGWLGRVSLLLLGWLRMFLAGTL